jgi:hypothetical protein
MKWLCVLGMAVAFCVSCQGFTDFMYGPDLTPNQLQDLIYEDAWYLGTVRAKDDVETETVLEHIRLTRMADDPVGAVAQRFYDIMREKEGSEALVWFAARRALQRIGIYLKGEIGEGYESVGFNKELFLFALDAYEEGFLSVRGQ